MSGQIRGMTQDEQRILLEWAAAEGWHPGVNDAACFRNLDPDGFLAIELDGRMAGGGAIIRHNETFGFMGLFIVHPEYRGRQLGRQLWNARRDQLLSRLAPGATIGLDGVDDMVSFYEQGGFRTFTRHRRFELSTPTAAASDENVPEIIDLQDVPAAVVHAFDRTCFPGDRDRFLRDWITQPGAVSLGYQTAQALQGFGVMRPCQVGWKLGPLFAEEFAVAEQLFRVFASRAGTGPLYLDAPDNNPNALRLCRSYAMNEVFGCTRMYLGPVPEVAHDRIYGITTLEVG